MVASQHQSGDACVTVQAPYTTCALCYDHNPEQCFLLRGMACFGGLPPEHQQKKNWLRDKYSRQRFLCGETLTAPDPELFFIFHFSFPKLFILLSVLSRFALC